MRIPKHLDKNILKLALEELKQIQKDNPEGLSIDETCLLYENWYDRSTKRYEKEDKWINDNLEKIKIQIANKYKNVWISSFMEEDYRSKDDNILIFSNKDVFRIALRSYDGTIKQYLFESKNYEDIVNEMDTNLSYYNVWSLFADREAVYSHILYTEVYDFIKDLEKSLQ